VSGTFWAVDGPSEAQLPGSLETRGSFLSLDWPHQALFTGASTEFGVLTGIDQLHQASLDGVLVGDSTRVPGDASFVQGQLLASSDMTLCLKEGSYFGWNNVDGTFEDGTYTVRSFNPLWVNYSVWYLTPSSGDPKQMQEYGLRPALNPQVGSFYANMYAPDQPGKYELRWRWQKVDGTYAHEIIAPFTTVSQGIRAQPSYI